MRRQSKSKRRNDNALTFRRMSTSMNTAASSSGLIPARLKHFTANSSLDSLLNARRTTAKFPCPNGWCSASLYLELKRTPRRGDPTSVGALLDASPAAALDDWQPIDANFYPKITANFATKGNYTWFHLFCLHYFATGIVSACGQSATKRNNSCVTTWKPLAQRTDAGSRWISPKVQVGISVGMGQVCVRAWHGDQANVS
jgi:hypothetical protein